MVQNQTQHLSGLSPDHRRSICTFCFGESLEMSHVMKLSKASGVKAVWGLDGCSKRKRRAPAGKVKGGG